MSVYITGASGFLGSRLKEHLGSCAAIPHKDIQSTDFSDATKVFFCSTYGNMSTHSDEKEIIKANILDLCHVLTHMDWTRLETFVFISSSSVKLKVQTTYSRTKRAAEEILLSYMERFNAPITIIRPFSITGVGEQSNHLIPTLIRSIREGKTVNLSPEPKHDFIDIADVVSGIMNLSGNQARGIFELGTGKSFSNSQVLELVEKELGKKADVNITRGMRPYDSENWVSTNFKSRTWGWYPAKSLEDSIREMANAK